MYNKVFIICSVVIAISVGIIVAIQTKDSQTDDKSRVQIIPYEITKESILGFLSNVHAEDGVQHYVMVDEASWMVGEEALTAAREDKFCTDDSEGCLPNGYYIRNKETLKKEFAFSKDAQFVMHTYDTTSPEQSTVVSREQFQVLINTETEHWNNLPYSLTLNNEGEITKIEEIFIP